MQLSHNTVVLVADGRKLLLLRNEGDTTYPNLVVEMAEESADPSTGEQATDRAGQASSPRGGARSSVEPTDFHQIEKDRFAAEAADLLRRRVFANDFESLIVVAPPRTLGELRKHYHKEISDRLAGELDKDLTGHAIPDIEQALLDA